VARNETVPEAPIDHRPGDRVGGWARARFARAGEGMPAARTRESQCASREQALWFDVGVDASGSRVEADSDAEPG
jgi:hypothetical protein